MRGGNATTGDGGALRIVGNAQLDLLGVYLHNNSAISGGAIHARGNSLTEILDLSLGPDAATGEPFRAEGNAANLGGAVYIGAYARLNAGGARIAENHAISGGGVYFGPDGEGNFTFGPGAAAPTTYGDELMRPTGVANVEIISPSPPQQRHAIGCITDILTFAEARAVISTGHRYRLIEPRT